MKKRLLLLFAISSLMACTIFARDIPIQVSEPTLTQQNTMEPADTPSPTATLPPPTLTPTIAHSAIMIRADSAAGLRLANEISTGQVWGAVISPDGNYASILIDENTLVVDLRSQSVLETIAGDSFQHIAFAPAGIGFAAVTSEGELVLRPAGNTESIRIPAHNDAPLDVVYAPKGDTVLTSSLDGTLKIWDSGSGTLLHEISGDAFGSGMIPEAISFSPDGAQAAVFLFDYSTLWVGDAASLLAGTPSGKLIPWLDHAGPVASVIISPDWQHLGWISRGTLQIMRIDGEYVGEPRSHEDWIMYPGFLEAQNVLYLASLTFENGQETGLIRGYSLDTGETAFEYKSKGMIVDLQQTPDGKRLVSGHLDGSVRVWDLSGNGEPVEISGHSGSIQSLSFSSDSTLAASLDENGLLQVWALSDGNVLWQTSLAGSGYFVMQFSDEDSQISVISETGRISFFRADP